MTAEEVTTQHIEAAQEVLRALGININIGACAYCGKITKLVRHHWWEPYGKRRKDWADGTAYICLKCNCILTAKRAWRNAHIKKIEKICRTLPVDINHILPPIELQKECVRLMSIGAIEYDHSVRNGFRLACNMTNMTKKEQARAYIESLNNYIASGGD